MCKKENTLFQTSQKNGIVGGKTLSDLLVDGLLAWAWQCLFLIFSQLQISIWFHLPWRTSQDTLMEFLLTSGLYCLSMLTINHCTMRLPMSIDISEVLKCKHLFHAHLNRKVSISFVGDAKIPKFWPGIKNFIIITQNMTFFGEKLKGWPEKVKIFVTYESKHLQKKWPK